MESKFKVSPDVARYNSEDEDNVTQVKIMLNNTTNNNAFDKIYSKTFQLYFVVLDEVEHLTAKESDIFSSFAITLPKLCVKFFPLMMSVK